MMNTPKKNSAVSLNNENIIQPTASPIFSSQNLFLSDAAKSDQITPSMH